MKCIFLYRAHGLIYCAHGLLYCAHGLLYCAHGLFKKIRCPLPGSVGTGNLTRIIKTVPCRPTTPNALSGCKQFTNHIVYSGTRTY